MARKITVESCNAFMSASKFKKANMSVDIDSKSRMVTLSLHGNIIAQMDITINGLPIISSLEITNAGWFSTTTKERLNGLPGVSVCQRNGVWFLNGNKWDGDWSRV